MRAHRLFGLLAALAISTTAYADRPAFGDTFAVGIGGMNHKADSTFRYTIGDAPPVTLDMQDLDMDQKATTVWVGGTWQFFDSWGISASYSNFDSKGDVITSKSGNYGDIDWDVNASLASELSLDLYIVDLHWDFINTGNSNVGVGVGLHVADLSASIGATVALDVNGQPVDPPINLGTQTGAVTAPLPNVMLRAGHRFGDNWYLGGTAGYFSLKVNDIDGELTSLRGSLEWRPGGGHLGAGLGYQYVKVDVKDTGGISTKSYDIKFYGPIFFLRVGI
ncbi:MAG: hypothetical protein PVH91_01495 [Pseudomonadales bacterium]|jgi:hypothetical protein